MKKQQNTLRKEKDIIREHFKDFRKSLTEEKKYKLDKKLCENFICSASFSYYDTLLLFAPINNEPDINLIAERAIQLGKRIAYPKIQPDTRKMTFHYIKSLSDLTACGKYNIPEPNENAPIFDPASAGCCACIVPALAYDVNGCRIGYGGGYYDRFISNFGGTAIGLIYEECIVKEVPHNQYDLKVHVIITEKGVRRIE